MEAQLFFKNRNTTDAVGWAQDAYKFVDTIEQAVSRREVGRSEDGARRASRACAPSAMRAHREAIVRRRGRSEHEAVDRSAGSELRRAGGRSDRYRQCAVG